VLDDFLVTLFQPPFELASAVLHFHVESAPVHDAQNNTSDKKLWNNFRAKP
jgi:hypothetical protein